MAVTTATISGVWTNHDGTALNAKDQIGWLYPATQGGIIRSTAAGDEWVKSYRIPALSGMTITLPELPQADVDSDGLGWVLETIPSVSVDRRARLFYFELTADMSWSDVTANGVSGIPQGVIAGRIGVLETQVSGYTDHGEVSGTLTLTSLGTHVLDATGALTVTLPASADDGEMVTLLVVSGADDVSVSGVDAEFTDGGFATFVMVRGSWVLASSGAAAGPPDTTPPSAITDLSATGGEGEIVADWSAATDAESTVHYRYRAWLTSGGASGAWTTTNNTNATITGLAAGAYTVEVYAYSAGGASATDTATATVTAPAGWSEWDRHEFTAADNTAISTLPTAQGRTYGGLGDHAPIVVGNKAAPNFFHTGTPGANNNIGTLTLDIPSAPDRMRHTLDYDFSNPGIGYTCYLDISILLAQTGAVGFVFRANSNSAPTAAVFDYTYAYSAGDAAPPIVYESGKGPSSGYPVVGSLMVEADGTGEQVIITIDGELVGHIDTSAFTYSGNPNPIRTDRPRFDAGNRTKIDRHLIETYS